MVAYSFSDDTKRKLDVDLVDFRHVVDILRRIIDHWPRERLGRIAGHTLTSELIPCAAEEKRGCRTLEIVPFAAALCIAQSEIASPIMTRIANPLVICRLPLETRWHDRKLGMPGEEDGRNSSLRPFDPIIPLCDRRHGIGSALVVRKDATHIVAFFDCARSKVVSHCHDNRNIARGVLESCSRGDSLAWYAQWGFEVTGVNVHVPNPYKVESKEDFEFSSAIGAAVVHSSGAFHRREREGNLSLRLQCDHGMAGFPKDKVTKIHTRFMGKRVQGICVILTPRSLPRSQSLIPMSLCKCKISATSRFLTSI